jgi:hypothetical protein
VAPGSAEARDPGTAQAAVPDPAQAAASAPVRGTDRAQDQAQASDQAQESDQAQAPAQGSGRDPGLGKDRGSARDPGWVAAKDPAAAQVAARVPFPAGVWSVATVEVEGEALLEPYQPEVPAG